MARILYGVHGTGHGHAMRALTIARRLRSHEFLFVAADDAPGVLEGEFPVRRVPNLGTVFKNYRVDLAATIGRAIPLLLRSGSHVRSVLRLMEAFKPDVCMTDLEFFVPRAARVAGLPCLTLDHQHVVTCCRHEGLSPGLRWDVFFQGLTPRWLFRPTEENLLVSFYAPPPLPRYNVRIVPPLLRDRVLELAPEDRGHVVVYQSNATDRRLVDFLRAGTRRPCYVFGYGRTEGREGNVRFMPKSEEGFLRLLEGCSYVIQGGSHTLMTEALHLGKPVFSIPLEAMVEQRLNAFYLEKLGYGVQCAMDRLSPEGLCDFELRLPRFRASIAEAGSFCGNDAVFGLVDAFVRTGALPGGGAPAVAG